jgi:aryl-alcohol dehydrogenase-like predicted oxidoreductase
LPEYTLAECYPPDHIEEFLHKSLENAGVDSFDLLQLHTWNDDWADDASWSAKLEDLKRQGLIQASGISINRWEPWNGVKAVRSGKIDSVQVIYNIFDQNPEDDLFPACREMDVAVIARVPFDEGTLTGTITKETKFPADDWRSHYFAPENLIPSVERADALKPLIPNGSSMPEMALRFILSDTAVGTIIPGMRKITNVEANIASSDKGPLPDNLVNELRKHRWVRNPAPWSD